MSEEKTVPAMSDAELERMLAQAGAASVQVPEGFRCGYVAVIGRPNVGKSTLINHLIGEKVSITSKKPQTTRDRVLGVVTEPDAQIVFMDTPGFQTKVGNQLIRRMNRTVRSTLGEVDAIIFVIESLGWKPADLEVLKLLPKDASNVILAINKTDLNKSKDSLLPLMAASMEKFPSAAIVPVSAGDQEVPPRERPVLRSRHLHGPLAALPRGRDDPREGLPPARRRASVRHCRDDRQVAGGRGERRDRRDPHRRA